MILAYVVVLRGVEEIRGPGKTTELRRATRALTRIPHLQKADFLMMQLICFYEIIKLFSSSTRLNVKLNV